MKWLNVKPSANGHAAPESTPSSAHFGRYGDVCKERDAWKRGTFGALGLAGVIALGLVFAIANNSPRIAVRDIAADGTMIVRNDATRYVSTPELVIDNTLFTFVRDLREVPPGGDYRFLDDRTALVHRELTGPNSDAERAETDYWNTKNPKDVAKTMTRHVFGFEDRQFKPTIINVGGLTYSVQWYDQTKSVAEGTLGPIMHRGGSITLCDVPALSTDNSAVVSNPANLKVCAFTGLTND